MDNKEAEVIFGKLTQTKNNYFVLDVISNFWTESKRLWLCSKKDDELAAYDVSTKLFPGLSIVSNSSFSAYVDFVKLFGAPHADPDWTPEQKVTKD